MNVLAVILGAIAGALLRWRVGVCWNLPELLLHWGTLTVNVGGQRGR